MVINPNHLLKRLEPSVRPSYVGGGEDRPRLPLESQDFNEMLALVSRGKVKGRPVEIGFEMNPLPDEQEQQRLSAAADMAEAAGANTAMLLLNGRGLLLDVGDRTLTAELSAGATSPIAKIDVAVYVAGEEDIASGKPLEPGRGLPGAGMPPPSVASRLEQLDEQAKDRSSAA